MSSEHLEKAPDAYRTISEVADDLDVPQHVLRFWETRFSQIRPLKRGGGRRYYRPDDVALIKGIRALLYGQGYTIKGVQRILKDHGVKQVQALAKGGVAAPAADYAPAPQAASAPQPLDDDFDDDAPPAMAHSVQPAAAATQHAHVDHAQDAELAAAQRRRLEAALAELSACRQMISVARDRQ